jgi:hypothetical protein
MEADRLAKITRETQELARIFAAIQHTPEPSQRRSVGEANHEIAKSQNTSWPM